MAGYLTFINKIEVFMKNVKFLLAIFTTVVVMASCATTQNTSGEHYDDENGVRRIGDRVYVDDPYYGRVILERDPFTGRYYDVTYGYRGYSSSYNRYNTYYRGNRSYPRYYRNNSNSSSVQKPSQQDQQKTREEARKKILGN